MRSLRHSDGMKHLRQQMFFLAAVVLLLATPDFAARQEPTPAQQNPPSGGQDAVSKAADHKKRFDEERRRLEETGISNSQASPAVSGQTLFISPAVVNMVLGDTQSFGAFDISGKTVTHSAQWSVSNSSVAQLSTSGDPSITSKSHGTVTVQARIGGNYAEAKVTVVPGASLAIGSVRWSSGDIPGFKTTKIIPAVPSASGVDVFEVAQNAQGEQLVRALMEDGRQLWMRYFLKGARPDSLPGMPKSVVPH